MNLLPLILVAFEFGRFNGREQEQFAQVYDKVSNGFRINMPFGELNHHLGIINVSIASALGSGSPS